MVRKTACAVLFALTATRVSAEPQPIVTAQRLADCGSAKGAAASKVRPLWMANGAEGRLTLERLAELAAPILWFSPREFLILETDDVPPLSAPFDAHAKSGAVYYRIRQLRLKDPDTQRRPILETSSPILRDVEQPFECPGGATLPIDEIDRVTIRYFFYYPEDRGIGGHSHDVEGLELQVRVRPACWNGDCFYSAVLESASGSAHGVGWYTSVLNVFKARDTELPLTVLVEENKHASAPDRDGDGVYMPHYDINVYSNDGWGVRDIAGTGTLGSPAYSTEQSRVVRPLHPERRVFPPARWPPRLEEAFANHERKVISFAGGPPANLTALPKYQLRRSWESNLCDRATARADKRKILDNACKTTSAASAPANTCVPNPNRLISLIDDPGFCAGPRQLDVKSSLNLKLEKATDVFAVVYPGPRNAYGYMKWTQRLSGGYRHDQGDGFSYIGPPIPGMAAPIFGGWLVGKLNVEFDRAERRLHTLSLDALYTPSASQSASWYVAAGREWRYRAHHAAVGQVATEVGLKFRFLAEHAPLAKFWGSRIGVRANGADPVHSARFIFEFGAGSW